MRPHHRAVIHTFQGTNDPVSPEAPSRKKSTRKEGAAGIGKGRQKGPHNLTHCLDPDPNKLTVKKPKQTKIKKKLNPRNLNIGWILYDIEELLKFCLL